MDAIFQGLNQLAAQFWGLWLMLLFLGVIFFAYAPSRKEKMKAYGRIPLDDDTAPPPPSGKEI